MSKKIKAVIAIGGTGGHVIPGYNLALHLKENNFIVDLVTDTRGLKYLKSTKKENNELLRGLRNSFKSKLEDIKKILE